MKLKTLICALLLGGSVSAVQAQFNIVGYINITCAPGFNALTVQLLNGDNGLNTMFYDVPNGTKAYRWNEASQRFDPPSVFTTGSGWSVNLITQLGRGLMIQNVQSNHFTVTLAGGVATGILENYVEGNNRLTFIGSTVPDGTALANSSYPVTEGETMYAWENSWVNPGGTFSTAYTYHTNLGGWYYPPDPTNRVGFVPQVGQGFFIRNPGPGKAWLRNFNPRPAPLPSTKQAAAVPQLTKLIFQNQTVTLTISNPAALTFDVQLSTNRVTWTTVATAQTGTNWSGPKTSATQAFYQLVAH